MNESLSLLLAGSIFYSHNVHWTFFVFLQYTENIQLKRGKGMYIIVNEDDIQFFIYHTRSHVEVIASNKEKTVRVESRTRKDAIEKAKRELNVKASPE